MTHLSIRSFTLAALAALATGLLVASPAAAAAPGPTQARATGGETTLKLARVAAGVSVSAIAPAGKSSSRLKFPITSGAVNPATLRGSITHGGSIRFSLGGKSIVLRNVRSTISRQSSSLSGSVGGSRLTLLRLNLQKAVLGSDGPLTVTARNIAATLSPQGAKALNRAIGTSLFRAGLKVGTVSTKVTLADVVLAGGATTLVPSPQVTSALGLVGVTLAPTGKASATATGFAFPIAGGKVDGKTLAGTIRHTGGVVASRGTASLTLTDFVVQIDATPTLSALVAGTRVEALALDISAIQLSTTPNGLVASNIGASLTAAAASALNQAFGTTVFSAGLRLGTVNASGLIS